MSLIWLGLRALEIIKKKKNEKTSGTRLGLFWALSRKIKMGPKITSGLTRWPS